MATQNLSIILDLQDKASKQLGKFQGKLESMQPTFQKMAGYGTVAFGAITAGIYKTTQMSAQAEGSWNKFNTVFAEGSEDMIAFIKDIRKEMPTATHEIARMSADLQDLLIPMGLGRKEAMGMTQEMVVLANKLGAFNDVDPTQVLEAFKSGLAGSSEPLRRFGINALDSSIEMEALETGLLKAGQGFKDLDPVVKAQVRAQALVSLAYKQSSDAINGFAENNDSLLRRQQNLSATFKEISVTIGNIFMPILDELVKKVVPVIETFGKWAEANPELLKWIVLTVLAVAGLVTILGALGLIIPLVINALLLFNPTALLIIGIIAGLVLAVRNVVEIFNILKNDSALVWEGIKSIINEAITWIIENPLEAFKKAVQGAISLMERLLNLGGVTKTVSKVGSKLFGVAKKVIGVDDAVISPNGNVISTHPDDYLIATKNPQSLGGGGGGIVITGNTLLSEDVAERIGDMIMQKLKLNTSM